MPRSVAVVVNVFPDVTACDDPSRPDESSSDALSSVKPHPAAVPFASTDPSVMAAIVRLRPSGLLSDAAAIDGLALVPSLFVTLAAVNVAGSALHK
jgi:hypothetical protein